MSPARSSHGRTATLLVLGVLLLTVCATVYTFLARPGPEPVPVGGISSDEEAARLTAEAHRLITLLTILLISALLILLFVLGAYLVIRAGQFLARSPVGGKPTEYVDAWRHYRLTDAQISAATAEDRTDEGGGGQSVDPDLDEPPSES